MKSTWEIWNFLPFSLVLIMVSNRECTCGFGKQSSLTFKSPYFWLHKELLISLKLPLLSRQSRNYTHTFQSECARGVCAHTFCSFVSPKTFILFTHLPLFLHNPGVFFSQQQSSFLFISCMNYTLLCVAGCDASFLHICMCTPEKLWGTSRRGEQIPNIKKD